MSEVKRYGSAVFDSGLIEMACGDYVTYSDYQKLVAENAALNASIIGIESVTDKYAVKGMSQIRDFIDSSRETPATDADIAEIKAQGVDSLSLYMELNGYNNEASDAREFAAYLRAGRKG